MTGPEWKAELRRQLEAADEAQVRAELRELSAGGEDRTRFEPTITRLPRIIFTDQKRKLVWLLSPTANLT
jgi:hypothetical protein